jgi:CBS domain-containing protein
MRQYPSPRVNAHAGIGSERVKDSHQPSGNRSRALVSAIKHARSKMGLTCQDVMLPPELQETIRPDATVATAFNVIRRSRTRILPVVDENGKYIGVFTQPTLMKLLLPKAATIGSDRDNWRGRIGNLSFMSLSKEDFDAELERLKTVKVSDNLSNPNNIPVAAPNTPIMEGIYLIHKFKRHVILVDPKTGRFVGTVSPNSLLDRVFGEVEILGM